MYLLDAMLPNTENHLKMDTARRNTSGLNQMKVKFGKLSLIQGSISKDPKIINQYIQYGPFTKGVSQDCPDRYGIYLGGKWFVIM